jgi:hypothetical protein
MGKALGLEPERYQGKRDAEVERALLIWTGFHLLLQQCQ